MAFGPRIPPGRAGRMWLRRRMDTAVRGRDQLDRKLRILVPEQQRLRLNVERSGAAWVAACETARSWLLRATLLGGEDAVRTAAPARPAQLELVWTTAMGLSYPRDARLSAAPPPPSEAPANAAVMPAAEAFRAALLAGVRSAAALEALRRVEAEIDVTRRRLRALDRRWLPWLAESLATLELSLEQAEQEDGMRLRRATAAADTRVATAADTRVATATAGVATAAAGVATAATEPDRRTPP